MAAVGINRLQVSDKSSFPNRAFIEKHLSANQPTSRQHDQQEQHQKQGFQQDVPGTEEDPGQRGLASGQEVRNDDQPQHPQEGGRSQGAKEEDPPVRLHG